MSRTVTLELPFPPSINRYWRRAGKHIHISNDGRAYRERVAWQARMHQGFGGRRVAVHITVFPPDARRRDLDNLCKACLDALQAGRLYEDDSQIDDLRVTRGNQLKPHGGVLVKVTDDV